MEGIPRLCRRLVAFSILLLHDVTAAGTSGRLPSDVDPKDARQTKVAIVLLLCASVLILILCFLFQRYTRSRDEKAAKELQRLQETDQFLLEILQNCSIQRLEQSKFRGITRKLHTATLEFQDIQCSVKSEAGVVTVLDDLSGFFEAGHLSAIMGPSGSGKTTFIDVLTGKKKTDGKWTVSGDLLVNGTKQSIESLKPVIGFVPQDDVVHEGLTVRENISFSARKRMPSGTSNARIRKITDDVMQALQLEPKQNMIVGNRVLSGEGLSGGQRKRVNVGLELAACPTILFLDEPTSGLDSTASLVLVQQLKRMAKLGMTIIMIIHQPRYSLFTLIDDVCLLGTGGKLAYIGPTLNAKPYFEKLGLEMPPNENPADWMMDVLCGEVDPQYSRIPKTDLPAALFKRWKENPNPGRHSSQNLGRRAPSNLEADVQYIKQHIKDAWSEAVRCETVALEKEHFAKVLKACTGITPSDQVTETIMQRVKQIDHGRQSVDYFHFSSNGNYGEEEPMTITQRSFTRYMIAFRGININDYFSSPASPRRNGVQGTVEESSSAESEEDDSQDDDAEASSHDDELAAQAMFTRGGTRSLTEADDLSRKHAGFCTHVRCTLHQAMLTFWRTMDMKILFLLVICFAAAFLAVFDRFIFQSPTWMPTSFLNAQIALALLVSVYSLQCFSVDQPMYWREASHGLNRASHFIGRALVNTLDWSMLTFFFVLVYYVIAKPVLTFVIYIIPFFLVSYVASGWGYAISCTLPISMGAFISAILAFMMGGILGLPMQMNVFLKGGFMEIIVDSISFTRWSAAMSFLAYIKLYPPDPQFLQDTDKWQLNMFKDAYMGAHYLLGVTDDSWWTGLMVLMIQGSVLRVVAYLGLRFVNRSRQV